MNKFNCTLDKPSSLKSVSVNMKPLECFCVLNACILRVGLLHLKHLQEAIFHTDHAPLRT